jgi:hypothetical protein
MRRRDFQFMPAAIVAGKISEGSLNTFAAGPRSLQRTGAPKRVIIIGAGLAGLSAGYELTQAGHDVTFLKLARGQAVASTPYATPSPKGCAAPRGFQITITSRSNMSNFSVSLSIPSNHSIWPPFTTCVGAGFR